MEERVGRGGRRSSPEINLTGGGCLLHVLVLRDGLRRFAAERRRVREPERSRKAAQMALVPPVTSKPASPRWVIQISFLIQASGLAADSNEQGAEACAFARAPCGRGSFDLNWFCSTSFPALHPCFAASRPARRPPEPFALPGELTSGFPMIGKNERARMTYRPS